MEKFFLQLRTGFQELNVVDHQHVHVTIVVTELCAVLLRDGVDKVVQEVFTRRV